jgi:O-antigen/teichoic acid export membrane protein
MPSGLPTPSWRPAERGDFGCLSVDSSAPGAGSAGRLPEVATIGPTHRALARDSVALVAGSVVNGIASYAVVAVGTRAYGAADFAPVSVMWTFWAMSVAVFTFPIQHWIIRTFQVDQGEGGVRRALPQLVVLTVAGSAVLTAVAFILRVRFFGSATPLWPLLVMLVTAGSAVTGYLRGVLSGRRRFVATGVAIAADTVVRLIACVVVVVIGGSVAWFAAAIAVGPVILLLWPSALTLRPDGGEPAVAVAGFLGGLAGGVLLSQLALNSGPAVLAAIGGAPAQVTALFATMALFRAPYLIAVGLASRGTAPLTRLVASGKEGRLSRLRTGIAVLGIAGALVGGLLGWWIGPAIVDLVFGSGVAPQTTVVAVVAAGSAVALAGLVAVLLLVARAATTAVMVSWTIAFLAATAVLLLASDDDLTRVAFAFGAAEVISLALMLAADRRAAGAAVA